MNKPQISRNEPVTIKNLRVLPPISENQTRVTVVTEEHLSGDLPDVGVNQTRITETTEEHFKGDLPVSEDPRILSALQDALRVSPVLEEARVQEIVDVFETCLTNKGNEIFLKINPLLVKALIEFGCSQISEVTMEDWRSLPWKDILSEAGFPKTPVAQMCNQVVFFAWTSFFFDLPFKVKVIPGIPAGKGSRLVVFDL